MLLFSYIYRIAAPIFLAFIIFLIIEPLARLLHRRGLKKPMASAFSTLIFVLLVLAVLVGLGVIVASQILALKEIIPRYTALLQEQINYRIPDLQNRWASLPPDLVQQIKDYFASFTDNLSKIATYLLGAIYGFLTSFSGAIFSFAANFVIGIVLAYFLSTEIDFWKRSAAENTPRTFKTAYYFVKHNVLRGIIGYIKAQLKLVSITFAIVLAGLIILGVGNAFSLALLSAFFFDILPLLGVPVIFVPWIVYLFIVGNTNMAVSLLVLLAVAMGTRQILEPKITGDTLAYRPLQCCRS